MPAETQFEQLLLGLLQSVESGELTANQARESLTRLVANIQVGNRQLARERFRLGAREQQRRARLTEAQTAERIRRERAHAIMRETGTIARGGPSSPVATAAVARLKELGDPVGAARIEEAAQSRHQELFGRLNKKLADAGAPLPDNLEQTTRELMQTRAGKVKLERLVDEKVKDTKRARLASASEQVRELRGTREAFQRLGTGILTSDPARLSKTIGERVAGEQKIVGKLLDPRARARQLAGRAKLTRGGLWGGGIGLLGLLLANKIFGKDEGPELSPQMQMQMALMAQQQAKQNEAGETIQQGRQLRNVSTLLGIIKMLQGMQGGQLEPPRLSRIA